MEWLFLAPRIGRSGRDLMGACVDLAPVLVVRDSSSAKELACLPRLDVPNGRSWGINRAASAQPSLGNYSESRSFSGRVERWE
jgi:hypothetical protein